MHPDAVAASSLMRTRTLLYQTPRHYPQLPQDEAGDHEWQAGHAARVTWTRPTPDAAHLGARVVVVVPMPTASDLCGRGSTALPESRALAADLKARGSASLDPRDDARSWPQSASSNTATGYTADRSKPMLVGRYLHDGTIISKKLSQDEVVVRHMYESYQGYPAFL